MSPKNIFFAFILLLASVNLSFTSDKGSEVKGIAFFEGSWEEALAKAEAEDKLIFLDVYATWCGPCKQLKLHTFLDEEVGSYFNKQYINVAINGESEEGRMLMKKYKLRAYPSLLIVDKNGELQKNATGYHDVREILKWAKRAV